MYLSIIEVERENLRDNKMTVKIKRKEMIMGKEVGVTVYLPEKIYLTRDRREKADKLDQIFQAEAEKINKEYERLDKKVKTSEIDKWRWLGEKLDNIFKNIPFIEEGDITNNYIWPAIGQYLRQELRRGLDDKKRSGTKNDHYRKCHALYTVPGTQWITSWVGWDAFTDRGAQLVYSNNFIDLLGKRFIAYKQKLISDDFKEIAKLTVKYIPTQDKNPVSIESMSEKKLASIIDSIYTDFIKTKK